MTRLKIITKLLIRNIVEQVIVSLQFYVNVLFKADLTVLVNPYKRTHQILSHVGSSIHQEIS